MTTRRDFLAAGAAAMVLPWSSYPPGRKGQDPLFRISLAQWSLNRELFSPHLT